jgi:4-amino-4-deoxy-L-arabinose transferase-like glycosyltransferase
MLVAALAFVLFALFLGHRPFDVPSEARYVEIAREMIARGDWLTPRLDGLLYFFKPPLAYWLIALSFETFGLGEAAARLPAALMGALGVGASFALARDLHGRRAAWLAALVLATCVMFFALARQVLLDMALAVLMSACLFALIGALRAPDGGPRQTRLLMVGYAAAGLAILAKGLVGLVLPGAAVLAWLALTGHWRLLARWRIPQGLALMAAIALPWHLWMAATHDGFVDFYLVREHLARFTSTVHHRDQPGWFFLPVVLAGLLPWTPIALLAIADAARGALGRARRDPAGGGDLLLLIWVALVLLFFSASSSKLVPYVLPLWPAVAVLVGRWLARDGGAPRFLPAALWATALILLTFAATLGLLPLLLSPRALERAEEALAAAGALRTLLPTALGTAALAIAFLTWRGQSRAAVAAVAVAGLAICGLGEALAGRLDQRSVKPLAETLRPLLQPGDEVASVHDYFQDLPFYLGREVTIVGWRGELEFGHRAEPHKGRLIELDELAARWRSEKRVYLVMARRGWERLKADGHPVTENAREIAATGYAVLMANR